MKNLFKAKPTLPTLEQNKFNGKSAERYFAANLTLTLDARVFWATRTEDDSKVDLVTVISHPQQINHVDVLFTQVKSGSTFAKIDRDHLIVHKDKFENLLNRNHNTLVCWSLVNFDAPYWFIIRANAKHYRNQYNETHKLTPLTRFDITRILTSFNNSNGGKGLTFTIKNKDFISKRNDAKVIYKKLKNKAIVNPLFGEVEFSRLGWRHITRSKRLNKFKTNTFDILGIAENIIRRTPSKHICYDHDFFDDKENRYRICEYILTYNDIQCIEKSGEKKATNVYVKLLEFANYNKDWRSAPNFSSDINRRIVFKSIYYKKSS